MIFIWNTLQVITGRWKHGEAFFCTMHIWKQHKQSVCDCCSVMCEESAKIWAQRRRGLSLTWIPQVGSPPPPQTWKKHGLTWCAQTPLFHFLRLPCCLSNKAETNAAGLLNYERWARVRLEMKSKVTGFRMSVLQLLMKPAAFTAKLGRIPFSVCVCFSLSRD